MRIEYRRGNFLDGPEAVSCHGCNAQGRMGGSVATQVRERFPDAFDAYLAAYAAGGLRLGSVIWSVGNGRTIANAVTQLYYGNAAKTGRVYVDYAAVAGIVAALDAASGGKATDRAGRAIPGFEAVAFPLIGAGLAGGEWERIASIIEGGSRGFRPMVYTRDGQAPG